MKRFKEIKDLLENVYFINEEAQLVVTFLENIGFSKPEKLVHDELGTLCGDREVMPAVDFFQECTGRKIDDRYSLSTVLVMAIDDYVSQLKEQKEEQYRSNEQARKDQDIVRSHDKQYKEILMWFVFLALTSEDSLGDVFEDLKRKDEEVALNVLEAMNCIVR